MAGPSLMRLLAARDPNDPLAFMGMANQTTSGIKAPQINPDLFNTRPSLLEGYGDINAKVADMVASNRAGDQAAFAQKKAAKEQELSMQNLQKLLAANAPIAAKPMKLKPAKGKPKPVKPKNKKPKPKPKPKPVKPTPNLNNVKPRPTTPTPNLPKPEKPSKPILPPVQEPQVAPQAPPPPPTITPLPEKPKPWYCGWANPFC